MIFMQNHFYKISVILFSHFSKNIFFSFWLKQFIYFYKYPQQCCFTNIRNRYNEKTICGKISRNEWLVLLRLPKKTETANLAFSIENQYFCYHRECCIMKIMCVLFRKDFKISMHFTFRFKYISMLYFILLQLNC